MANATQAASTTPSRSPMVGWYDPSQLFRTAIDVAISTIFGRHADYRLMEALDGKSVEIHDYSKVADDEVFWADYVADTGDGWNSTYAVAYAISQQDLALADPSGKSHQTRRGRVLIFGGDEVYPVASRDAYKTRLIGPYETALKNTDPPHPDAYAVPGNHDWYDSLVSFSRLFCSRMRQWFAGWQTKQTRSYFALKLPRGWWLIGTDIQLDSDVDEPQVEFFRKVADAMGPDDRIILCNAEPHWIYAEIYGEADPSYNENNLKFIEERIFGSGRVRVFLAGDLHHYRRHASADGTQKVTAGGGGAFLHPTHGPSVDRLKNGDFALAKAYPDVKTSRHICWRNINFLGLNPAFGIVPGILYVLTAWSTSVNLSSYPIDRWFDAMATAINHALATPVAAFWGALVFGGFWLFTDSHSNWFRWTAGTLHGAAHLGAVFTIGWWTTVLTSYMGLAFDSTSQLLASGAIILFAGWFVGSVLMGIYLLISLNVFAHHSNEAFSSLHIEDWKNFLRLRIDAAGDLWILPVGIDRVPRKWKAAPSPSASAFTADDSNATAPRLIEPPIRVEKSPNPIR